MGLLTPDNRKTEAVYQPHMVRYHHAYRSPINSERFNLQQQAFAYDIFKLYGKTDTLKTKVDTQTETLFDDGIGITGSWSWKNSDLTVLSPMTIQSLNGLMGKLKLIEQRTKVLEQVMPGE